MDAIWNGSPIRKASEPRAQLDAQIVEGGLRDRRVERLGSPPLRHRGGVIAAFPDADALPNVIDADIPPGSTGLHSVSSQAPGSVAAMVLQSAVSIQKQAADFEHASGWRTRAPG